MSAPPTASPHSATDRLQKQQSIEPFVENCVGTLFVELGWLELSLFSGKKSDSARLRAKLWNNDVISEGRD